MKGRVGVVMGRFNPGRHQQDPGKFYKDSENFVVAGGGHIKHKFMKHYQVFLITVI